MKFKDVADGQIFYENITGEFYMKIDEDTSVMWDYSLECVYRNHSGEIECNFPPDHEVFTEEELDQ